ncbi:MAG TPA: hypothetical protein VH062_18060 [Polyangiaceae bacterium]|jgi:hypothetical protein|nr:hypothetical protein [Polyangiaceae bacterium]
MFHSSNPTLFGRPEGVLAETEALHSTLAGLRRVSNSLIGNVAQARIEARRLLATFSSVLARYFNGAESGAYFGAILAEYPHLAKRVSALGSSRADLQGSVTSVRRLAFRDADTAELGRRIDGVIDVFEEHERSEAALLRDFFGGGRVRAVSRAEAP